MSIELEEVEKKQKMLKRVAKIGGLAYASELDMSVQAQETGERMRMPKKKKLKVGQVKGQREGRGKRSGVQKVIPSMVQGIELISVIEL